MLLRTVLLTLLLAICPTMAGCAALSAAVPVMTDVLIATQDAAAILTLIQTVEHAFFAATPNPVAQAKVDKALQLTELALDTALRATKGVKDMSQKDVDAAFADFKTAYADLLKVLAEAGVSAPGVLGATPGQHAWPEPLALHLTVSK